MSDKRYHASHHDRDAELSSTAGPSPGKLPATARLGGRAQTNIIFRVESAEAARELSGALGLRDRNGVADGADVAVDRASGSSGASLPSGLRERFEASLGTDLSSVRLHTGADSAAAADAVGARAYTTGQDIHFGAGQYDPSGAFGVHLLAHEVAHTVQQQGGPPTRQHKLEVSGPQDAAEVEADRAADAMVAGGAFTLAGASSGLHRKPVPERDPASSIPQSSWQALPREFALADHARREIPKMVRATDSDYLAPEEMNIPEAHVAEDSASKSGHGTPKQAMATFAGADLAWRAIEVDAYKIYSAWNDGVGSLKALRASVDEGTLGQLRKDEAWQGTKGFEGDIVELAQRQQVGSKTKPMTVKDAVDGTTTEQERDVLAAAAGEEIYPASGEAKDPVRDAYHEATVADSELAASVEHVLSVSHAFRKALHDRQTVILGRELLAANATAANAREKLAELNESKENWKLGASLAFKAVEFGAGGWVTGAAGLAANPTAGEYLAGQAAAFSPVFRPEGRGAKAKAAIGAVGEDTATAVGGNAAHDVVGMIAEGIVNLAFASSIRQAESAVKEAERNITALTGKIQDSKERAADEGVAEQFHALREARDRVVAAKQQVNLAYSKIATAVRGSKAATAKPPAAAGGMFAGLFGGGAPEPSGPTNTDAASRMAGKIAAIPVVRALLGRINGTYAQLQLPEYTALSGQGYWLWEQVSTSGQSNEWAHLADLHGKVWFAQGMIQTDRELWTERLRELEDVLGIIPENTKR